jgi:type IV secretion system protein TrbJ
MNSLRSPRERCMFHALSWTTASVSPWTGSIQPARNAYERSTAGGTMQLKLKKPRKWLIVGAAVLATATPGFALFGLGDIVFDPTSYANLVKQFTTLQMQYNTIKNNLTHFSVKQQWQAVFTTLKNTNVKNLFGETNGMTTALNTNSPSASSTAWTAATIPVSSSITTYLQGRTPGSAQLSQLAMIEASDSVSPDCLTAVGQYRAARTQNATAVSTLAANELDGSDATNSEVQQLNLLNAAEAQKMAEMQTQGTLQSCLASQMAVANMQQRNAAAIDLNTAAFVQQQRAANNVNAAREGNTWQTYLP